MLGGAEHSEATRAGIPRLDVFEAQEWDPFRQMVEHVVARAPLIDRERGHHRASGHERLHDRLDPLGRNGRDHRPVDRGGRDRVHGHPGAGELARRVPGQGDDRRLRGRVVHAGHRPAGLARDRGEVDDPAPRLAQVWDRGLRHEREATEVDRELAVDVPELRALEP